VDARYRYLAIVPEAGDTMVALVDESANEWSSDVQPDEDVEKRFEGMAEEVFFFFF
jgi:hypothetical protein